MIIIVMVNHPWSNHPYTFAYKHINAYLVLVYGHYILSITTSLAQNSTKYQSSGNLKIIFVAGCLSMLFYLHEPLPEGSGNSTCDYLHPRAIGNKTAFETAFHDL